MCMREGSGWRDAYNVGEVLNLADVIRSNAGILSLTFRAKPMKIWNKICAYQ